MSGERGEHLICVPPERTGEVWPAVRDFIDRGYAASDEFVPSDILERLSSGVVLLWVVVIDDTIVAALLTDLARRRSGLVCRMICAGGSRLDVWQTWHTRIEDYARAEGCVRTESEVRPGFTRALSGYQTVRHVIVKRLGDG